MRTTYLISGISFLALLSPAHAMAQSKIDANGDDEISRIEYMSFRSNAFNKEDKNFDGKLTKQEIRAARDERNREKAKTRFKGLDSNRDGGLTQDEFAEASGLNAKSRQEQRAASSDKWFDDMDADKNGNISRLEYNGFLDSQMKKV